MKVKLKSKKFPGKFIYGDILENKKSKTLAIFISGFSGSRELPLFKVASPEFHKKGFSTLRFNFCYEEEDKLPQKEAPKLEKMSASVYVSELKNIIDSFGKKYQKIVLIGHSFGAIVAILFLNKFKQLSKKIELIMWDQSLFPWDKKFREKIFVFDPVKKLYYTKDRELAINKTFYNELGSMDSIKLFRALNKRACIIGAGKYGNRVSKKYFAVSKKKGDSLLRTIEGTGHMFDGKKTQKKLFEETVNFLKS